MWYFGKFMFYFRISAAIKIYLAFFFKSNNFCVRQKQINIRLCFIIHLTLSWRRPLLYRNQSIYLLCKSLDWFLYDNGLPYERVKNNTLKEFVALICVKMKVTALLWQILDIFKHKTYLRNREFFTNFSKGILFKNICLWSDKLITLWIADWKRKIFIQLQL